ncbi:hypothetical protein BDF22DRAFT_691335 [Syncephalis plumigaleata]|nr:hypothetical protein BDF22DRAFT_691335 [Syncephalis plumigaleata]
MPLLNISHEPTSLVMMRVFYILIASLLLCLALARGIRNSVKLKDVYDVEYHLKPLPIPTIIFRSIVTRDTLIRPNVTFISQSQNYTLLDSRAKASFPQLNWTENVIDSGYPTQDWKLTNDILTSASLSNSWLYMNMLNASANFAFVPKLPEWYNSTVGGKTLITKIKIQLSIRSTNTSTQISGPPVDIFVIDNPRAIVNRTNSSAPFDLATVDVRSRFTARFGYNTSIGFLQSNRITGDVTDIAYDLSFFESGRTSNASTIEFEIVPRNKVFIDEKGFIDGKGFMVRHETAAGLFDWAQVLSTLGGAFSLLMFVFKILFGQFRLRPWGFVQRRLLRNKILRQLPESMVSLKTAYKPEVNQDSITDMTYLDQPHPLQPGIVTSWMPKHAGDLNFSTFLLNPSQVPNTTSVIGPIQRQSSCTQPRTDEISQLRSMMEAQKMQAKAQMEAQMKQFAIMSDRLAALESGNTSPDNTTAMLNALIANNNRLPHLSLNQHHINSTIMSSGTTSSLESRVSNLEMFQYRLGTIYLSNSLFDDTTFS